jgi:hypothetical protein
MATRPAERAMAKRPVESISALYELGQRVLDRARQDHSSIMVAARILSVDEDVGFDRARKAAHFARTFHRRDVTTLSSPGFGPFPVSADHVRRVLKVAKREEQMTWLRRAAEQGWSARRLGDELRRATGGAGGRGGPRLRAPGSLLAALTQVINQSEAWLKRHDGLWVHDTCWPPVLGQGEEDPAVLRDRLRETRQLLGRLGESAKVLGERLSRLKIGLGRGAGRGGADRASSRARRR